MRIGIFGGSFDPPHVGHLLAASDAFEALELDRLLFVPTARQPLKPPSEASPADRIEMLRLLIAGDRRFSVDPVEIERGGLSYTVDTLRTLHERWQGVPGLSLILLLGSDAAAALPHWREPDEVGRLAEVVVLTRANGAPVPSGGRAITTRRVDVSSTEIRERVRRSAPLRGFVPEPLAAFIARRELYREEQSPKEPIREC